ncbi:hypothetical protein [Halodesulfovibrio sp.]|uniref:hypothetical protein n=1 Tax=Halodesulfovibrio sp. TaxID=1912772 RepID=UPI0025BE3AD8|nr:hypothetical protein [Halodesulfovibrio sp.]
MLDISIMNKVFTFTNYLDIVSRTVDLQKDKYEAVEVLERLLLLWGTASQVYSLATQLRKLAAENSPHHVFYETSLRQMGGSYKK